MVTAWRLSIKPRFFSLTLLKALPSFQTNNLVGYQRKHGYKILGTVGCYILHDVFFDDKTLMGNDDLAISQKNV